MVYDGSLKFDTKIDESGFSSGIWKLGSIAKGGLGLLAGAVAGVSAAMGTGIAASIKVGASFEAEMSKVSAISGSTGTDLERLTEKAKEMGAKTKFSATESAQAMEYMAMAGWKTEDMLTGIDGIMNLAAASGEDLAATSDIVTDALTAFGMAASDSGRFADVLAAASSNSNTNVGMMGETFKYVAPVAGALGYSAEDTAVAIGLMANSGIKAGQAGTSLRSMLTRLVDPTDEVKASMDSLGISMTDSEGNVKSLDTLMSDLRTSFSGLSEAEKTQMASSLAGQEAMSGLLAIVNASDSDFGKLKDSIYNCDGAAQKMAETMQDNLQGQLTILKSSAEGLGIEIYESIQKPLTDIAKIGIDVLNDLTAAFKENGSEGLIEAGGQILTNLLLGIAERLPTVIDTAIQILQSIITNLNANLPQLLSAGGQILQSLVMGIVQLLPMLGELALNLILQLAQGITNNASQIISKGVEILLNFVNGILSSLPQLITAGIELIVALVNGLVAAIPQLIAYLPTIISTILDALIGAQPQILAAGVQILVALVNGIIETIPTLIAAIPQVIAGLINAIINNLPQFISSGLKIIGALAAGIIQAIPSIVGATPKIISSIVNAMRNVNWGDVGLNIIKGIANGILGGVGAIVSAAQSAARSALNSAKRFLGIRSPSRVFRDQVGKYMAEGMGVGFEQNIPTEDMNKSIGESVNSMQKKVGSITKSNPVTVRENPVTSTPKNEDNPVVLETTNVFQVDGDTLVEKTTKATIKKIGKDQSAKRSAKGK